MFDHDTVADVEHIATRIAPPDYTDDAYWP